MHLPNPKALEAFKLFSKKFPTAMLGGSLGLFLQGVYLDRPLGDSDLDITVQENIDTSKLPQTGNELGSGADFQYSVLFTEIPDFTIKIDVVYEAGVSVAYVRYEGEIYRVRPAGDIIEYKREYAKQHSEKHILDCKAIDLQIGVCPDLKVPTSFPDPFPDLPF